MRIIVLKQDKPIGYLEEKSFDNVNFIYFDNVPKSQYIAGLSEKENHSQIGLFLIFKNLLPENNQIEQLKVKYNISSNIELLLYLEDIHGSYSFLTEDEYKDLSFPNNSIIYNYEVIKSALLNNSYTFPNILNYNLDIPKDKLFPDGVANSKVIGLSGFQYKFSVIKDDKNKKLTIDNTKLSEYFMKPYSKYYSKYRPHNKDASYIPYLLVNEHIFMTIARDIGFSVPYNAIIKDGADYHYIIKRFDRYQQQKFDHEEFATLLGYDSDTKYDATAIELIEVAKDSIDNIMELILFFFFSTIISHGDLHSKNVSLIFKSNKIDEQDKQLSPYYDISTTHIYKGLKSRNIGIKIMNKKTKIKKEDFINLASKFDIDLSILEKEMKRITQFFLENFLKYVELLPQEIKELPFYTGNYMYHKPFSSILGKYFDERKQYIKKYIDKNWIVTNESIF